MLLCLLWTGSTDVYGQKARQRRMGVRVDSLALKQQAITDSLATDSITTDSLAILNQKEIEKLEAPVDTALLAKKNDSIQNALPTEKKRFIPNSNRATWLALIIPGGGQIYNRKYWKLPIVYGGFMGCAYALSWNGKMYKDYSQAYLDIMDDDPNTKSYEDFLPPNADISGQEERYKDPNTGISLPFFSDGDFRPCSTGGSCSQAPFCLCTRGPISVRPEETFARLRYLLGGLRPIETVCLRLSLGP